MKIKVNSSQNVEIYIQVLHRQGQSKTFFSFKYYCSCVHVCVCGVQVHLQQFFFVCTTPTLNVSWEALICSFCSPLHFLSFYFDISCLTISSSTNTPLHLPNPPHTLPHGLKFVQATVNLK